MKSDFVQKLLSVMHGQPIDCISWPLKQSLEISCFNDSSGSSNSALVGLEQIFIAENDLSE